ncbi:MAG: Uma2 family endonuclease [Dolichospermum sp. DET50]|nr:Uma2 family endonuclease [Dolichospermum sp. DET66]MBS3033698.1 Uma2 family endonuclease [Dolichospermum sp. DET67]MBS3038901.1 Uma2 family endonuclease [Dolichospermum sp. DET50]QSX66158.1 MAG: Uma2 family endonuclease [Dolichospermum sp. DET69]
MVIANLLNIVTDTWVNVSWDEFMEFVDHPNYQQGRFYYYQDYMRIEMSPVGSIHGNNNNVVANVVNLYATLKNIKIKGWVNTSFRRTSESECQPDLAFYIGEKIKFPPLNNSPVNINELAAPTLVVEIAASSINDDLGFKRLLYERLGVKEYWVMNANNDDIIAFEIVDGGSRRIEESKVLPGLQLATVKEAIHRSLTQDDGEVNRWLLGIFS